MNATAEVAMPGKASPANVTDKKAASSAPVLLNGKNGKERAPPNRSDSGRSGRETGTAGYQNGANTSPFFV